ncbi:diguanylate cyclase [Aliarcobacter skirrowii]|uniref:diguanylate cyclase n=1 Tax=Aliarcobacter skirrowii CCUG 10374 TaxID=1032239 RepID=A0AAD0WPB6_9BACT|nr:diguanylate cyclase [Aliarcobacter skirrowii]AXX85752.1 diguanylate cyclase [Aliarcobacter skirrowii CCUG 10374]KAB0622006.1 diguanylate cyclase [Aliarcobacter skirrowii CCUG 10374]MDX4038683.1 diguanylate cyclase [Aliarcobacter skirrowii]RXI27256.1 sensor domain-containing diguanylate cyclase [Aliarcobacter skirrowii CCUG 10374]SUU95712.1 Stalked cell differentiation-controlling protein [Aliarcobacter skirrowii]
MDLVFKKLFKKGVSLKSTILLLFSTIGILLILVLAYQLLFYSKKLAISNINSRLDGIALNIQNSIKDVNNSSFSTVNTLALLNDQDRVKIYTNFLKSYPSLYAIYTGYEDNSFYEFINLRVDKNLISSYSAKDIDRWLLIKIDGKNSTKRELFFYDDDLNQTDYKIEPNSYLATKRPWFKDAKNSKEAIKTKPYTFSHIDSIGITYAKSIKNGKEVVAIDLLIADYLNSFKNHVDINKTELYLFDSDKLILSSLSKNSNSFNDFILNISDLKEFENTQIVEKDNKKFLIRIIKIDNNKQDNYLALIAEYKNILKPYNQEILWLLFVFIFTGLITIPLILYFSRVISKPIYSLVRQSKKIEKQDFNISKIDTSIQEISLLSCAFSNMSKSIYDYQTSLEEKILQRTKELYEKNEELERLSITDKLTGLYNRAKLDSVLNTEFEKAIRYNDIFSVIIMDIDFFKSVNDNFGHQIGDDVLKESAKILSSCIRTSDTLGRWGGEEFLIICPNSKQEDAIKLANRINIAIKQHTFSTYPKKVTMSLGVASYCSIFKKAEDIVASADIALYKAKQTGRDRVVGENDI